MQHVSTMAELKCLAYHDLCARKVFLNFGEILQVCPFSRQFRGWVRCRWVMEGSSSSACLHGSLVRESRLALSGCEYFFVELACGRLCASRVRASSPVSAHGLNKFCPLPIMPVYLRTLWLPRLDPSVSVTDGFMWHGSLVFFHFCRGVVGDA